VAVCGILGQCAAHPIALQRIESGSYVTVVDMELMKKFPNRDPDWLSNARDSTQFKMTYLFTLDQFRPFSAIIFVG
jgi:hypothetical protein